MKTEPTDEQINYGIAFFCGLTEHDWESGQCRRCFALHKEHWADGCARITIPRFTTSFDALREAMGKMNGQQQASLLSALYDPCAGHGPAWLLYDMPARTLAEAVYQVVKGENK